MNEDEIMAEVRKQRATILETHGGSLEKHHAAIEASQAKDFAGRLVTLSPRRRVAPSVPDYSSSRVLEP